VVLGEPDALSEVGSLPGGLEVQPLRFEVFVVAAGSVEFVVWVVLFDQVLDYGAGFPEGDVCVGIDDGGNTRGG